MTDLIEQEEKATRAWVLHPELTSDPNRRTAGPALEEAVSLAAALPHLEVEGAEIVRLRDPHPGKLFSKGKLDDLSQRLKAAEVDLVLIDGPVSPVQQRNLEKEWNVKILDRTGLILEIFSDRARTREGVLQVEMAALSYQRTRLVRAWTHLERQRGGLGFVGGPGETQIEADRRAIDDHMNRLRKQLEKVVKTRELHRAARAKVPFPIVALVGYTNAGKSTLFNRMTGAKVLAKDMLFATLDPTMRQIELPALGKTPGQGGGRKVILSDTVGFISDLPTQLVAAFRATLEEVLAADLILHVRDISHEGTDEQAQDVATIMAELGVSEDTPQLEIWNKLDLLDEEEADARRREAARHDDILTLSAITGEGFDDLIAAIDRALDEPRKTITLNLAFSDGRKRAWLFEKGIVEDEEPGETGWKVTVTWTDRQASEYAAL